MSSITERFVSTASQTNLAYAAVVLAVAAIAIHRVLSVEKRSVMLPPWTMLEFALVTYMAGASGITRRIYSLISRYGGSFFGISKKHQVIVEMPSLDRFLGAPLSSLEVHPLGWTMVSRVFGVAPTAHMEAKVDAMGRPLTAPVERMFLNEAGATAAILRADVPGRAAKLVGFSPRPDEVHVWERAAAVRLVKADGLGKPEAVEADMFRLLCDFGMSLAVPLMYGHHFLECNPGLIADFWKFDHGVVVPRLFGFPEWVPLKSLREGLAARARIHDALEGLFRRIDQHEDGRPVDSGLDMSDLGRVVLERNRVFHEHGITSHRERGELELGTLWGQNANTQPLLFWLVLHIYATPGLLDAVRREAAPFVVVSAAAGGPPAITSFDIQAICRDCPLLKSAMFETFRLCSAPSSIRYVAKPLTVRDGDHTHHLPANSWVNAAHAVAHKNPAFFPDPDSFKPDRFVDEDAETGRRVARYGRLKPWGAGQGICKGRVFAEKEIMGTAAALTALWDIEPASGGEWKLPAMIPGVLVMNPTGPVRVVVKRRAIP